MIKSNDEEMSHMRQMISKHMVDSLSTSAHVHVMTDVDMSRIVEFVKLNEVSFKKSGILQLDVYSICGSGNRAGIIRIS